MPTTRARAAAPGGSFIDRHFWLLVGGLLLLALAVRVGYVLHTQGFHVRNDDKSYDYLARTLAAGHGWGYSGSAYRPPGYPVFLTVIYLIVGTPHGDWTAARLVEALVSALTVGLIGWLALQIAGRRAALISMAIGAVYVPLVLVGVSLMTESLFVTLMLLAVNCALRSRNVGAPLPVGAGRRSLHRAGEPDPRQRTRPRTRAAAARLGPAVALEERGRRTCACCSWSWRW